MSESAQVSPPVGGRRNVPRPGVNRDRWVNVYLCVLVFTIPMDWFRPTGYLLREGGARPSIPLMLAASVYLLYSRRRKFLHELPTSSYRILLIYSGIVLCGFLAFMLNLIVAWSRFGGMKNPVTQFATQMLLLAIVPFIIVTHAELFRAPRLIQFVVKVLPWAAFIHFTIGLLNAIRWLDFSTVPLIIFRNSELNRVSGLMSEPSYFGTMAAIYGLPLLIIRPKGKKRLQILLAMLFFVLSIYIGAKTVIPVAVCGTIAYMWYSRDRLLTPLRVAVLLSAGAVSMVFVTVNSTFDLQENLSSAMRIGSALTAMNAAAAGYGITGVGFGQFHFMFREQFMPKFLLLSSEALTQMSSTTDSRASTFDLFARYWIETGIVGLFLFLGFLRYLFKMAKEDRRLGSLLGILIMATSLGFLLTQDPYCYPPIMLGAALVLGAHNENAVLSTANLQRAV
jgi:hypothetical protein